MKRLKRKEKKRQEQNIYRQRFLDQHRELEEKFRIEQENLISRFEEEKQHLVEQLNG